MMKDPTLDAQHRMDLVKFATLQIKRMISLGGTGEYIYQKNLDRVIYDITGYTKLASKVRHARTMRELQFVYSTFEYAKLKLFTDSRLCHALEDLIQMDFNIRKLRKGMNKAKQKGKKPDKDEVKVHDKTVKLYRKTIKYIRNELKIRNSNSSKFFKESYQAAKNLVRKPDDTFHEFAFDTLYDDYDIDTSDDGNDLFDEFMERSRRGRRAKPTYLAALDDDDDDDDPLGIMTPDDSPNEGLIRAISSLERKMDQLGSLVAINHQSQVNRPPQSNHNWYQDGSSTAVGVSRRQPPGITPDWVIAAKQQYTPTTANLPVTSQTGSRTECAPPVGYSVMNMMREQARQAPIDIPTDVTKEELIDMINSSSSTPPVESTTESEPATEPAAVEESKDTAESSV